MSIYKAPLNSGNLQKKFQDLMVNMSEEQVYKLHDSCINKDTLFSISANKAVYKDNEYRVDKDKNELFK